MGVFSSWVTALIKLSCCSLRLISRTRKVVFKINPAAITPKKITPRITFTSKRQFKIIQPNPIATTSAARHTPSDRNVIIARRRLVMRIRGFYRAEEKRCRKLSTMRKYPKGCHPERSEGPVYFVCSEGIYSFVAPLESQVFRRATNCETIRAQQFLSHRPRLGRHHRHTQAYF